MRDEAYGTKSCPTFDRYKEKLKATLVTEPVYRVNWSSATRKEIMTETQIRNKWIRAFNIDASKLKRK